MRCPKCKRGRLRQQVSVFVECDLENHSLNKKGIRSRDVTILGAGWPQATILCPKCGYLNRLEGRERDER